MSSQAEVETRWFGWGDVNKTYEVERRPDLIPNLEKRLGMKISRKRVPDPDISEVKLRSPRLSKKVLDSLGKAVGKKHVSTSHENRVRHSYGKSYRDLMRLRQGKISNPPDAVLFPGSEAAVKKVLKIADENMIAVVPFAGGSSVVGGVECMEKKKYRGAICVDMRRMNKVVSVDPYSLTATAEAGIWGPDLEDELAKSYLYLGHAPESFKFSPLGGWIASRAAGRQSTGYGKIEEMTEGVRMVSPRGVVDTLAVPASAAGPCLRELVVGSEGTLGIITRATMKVRPLPDTYDYRGLLFKDFEAGAAAVREMLQKEIAPCTVRISDPEESAMAITLRKPLSNPMMERGLVMGLKALKSVGYSFNNGCYSVLGVEGTAKEVGPKMNKLINICRKHGALPLGKIAGMEWYKGRYDHPYLRDIMLGWGIMVDTLETATNWDNIMNLYHVVRKAIREAIEDTGSPAIVTCHISHSYPQGSSLYFIFLGLQAEGQEIEQWEQVKKAASEAIVRSGGTISHHHGVGYEHAPWFPKEIGPQGIKALKALKRTLDPKGIMNPGKLRL